VRAALEEGVARLVGAVTRVDYQPCMAMRPGAGAQIDTVPAEKLRKVENPPADTASAARTGGEAVNTASQTGTRLSSGAVQIGFEFGSNQLSGATMALLDQIAVAAKAGAADVVLVARDNEVWDAGKRDALTDQRMAAFTSALANRGIAPAAISVTWRPDAADSSIHRDGPGLQEIAKLRIGSAASAAAAPSVQPTPEAKGR